MTASRKLETDFLKFMDATHGKRWRLGGGIFTTEYLQLMKTAFFAGVRSTLEITTPAVGRAHFVRVVREIEDQVETFQSFLVMADVMKEGG